MIGALIGIYYKTRESAVEAFDKMSDWKKKNHNIIEFENAYLIVSNEQIKTLKNK